MSNDFDSSFVDSEGVKWTVLLSTKTVRNFCKESSDSIVRYNLWDIATPLSKLNLNAQLELMFQGIKHHTDAKRITFDDFVDYRLEGEALDKSLEALNYAVVNFTLLRLNERERVIQTKKIKDALAEEQKNRETVTDDGNGNTSTILPPEQMSSPSVTTQSEN